MRSEGKITAKPAEWYDLQPAEIAVYMFPKIRGTHYNGESNGKEMENEMDTGII